MPKGKVLVRVELDAEDYRRLYWGPGVPPMGRPW